MKKLRIVLTISMFLLSFLIARPVVGQKDLLMILEKSD